MTTSVWIWLVLGCIPYHVSRVWNSPSMLTLTITAIFWSVMIERHVGDRYNWTVRVPLISRLKEAIWAAVIRLRSDSPLEDSEDHC